MSHTGGNRHNIDLKDGQIASDRHHPKRLTVLLSGPPTSIDMVVAQSKGPLCIRSEEQE
jgi:hypothetical protein